MAFSPTLSDRDSVRRGFAGAGNSIDRMSAKELQSMLRHHAELKEENYASAVIFEVVVQELTDRQIVKMFLEQTDS